MNKKSGFAAILGRTNVGKSTLLNKIIGQKIVITSEKPQTTRQRLRGVYTSEKGQIVFVDTPGIHKPKYKLGDFLIEEATQALNDVDIILFIVDGSEKAGSGDIWIKDNLIKDKSNVILVLNKLDLIKDMKKREEIIESYISLFDFPINPVKISALTGRNIDTLISEIFKKLPEGPMYYEEELVTDQSMRMIAKEIIREKILLLTKDEIPHSTAIVIDKFEETEKIIKIKATIHVEQDSQKGIIIGKKGSMLKMIGTQAREDIEKMVENKVFLELFVKVTKNWRKDKNALKEFGYQE